MNMRATIVFSLALLVFSSNIGAKAITGFLEIPWGSDIEAVREAFPGKKLKLKECRGVMEGQCDHWASVNKGMVFNQKQSLIFFYFVDGELEYVEATKIFLNILGVGHRKVFMNMAREIRKLYGDPIENTRESRRWSDEYGEIELYLDTGEQSAFDKALGSNISERQLHLVFQRKERFEKEE